MTDDDISQATAHFPFEFSDSSMALCIRVVLFLNCVHDCLSIEWIHSSIQDCQSVLNLGFTVLIASLIQGISLLWISQEVQIITVWSESLDSACNLSSFYLMFTLVNNANFRLWLVGKRFSISLLTTPDIH
jgi:hypothetical protein